MVKWFLVLLSLSSTTFAAPKTQNSEIRAATHCMFSSSEHSTETGALHIVFRPRMLCLWDYQRCLLAWAKITCLARGCIALRFPTTGTISMAEMMCKL
ncbi:hypothetical protein Zmor_027540 [Zophobas morio]|uniref:Secreted protein n=1 Tax=Zophobas morio TaxID=2755281 RepID=A0AA38HNQ8_9CUCU|nr:hypothetical protein Zmor_027540 [Zophobas morio]